MTKYKWVEKTGVSLYICLPSDMRMMTVHSGKTCEDRPYSTQEEI